MPTILPRHVICVLGNWQDWKAIEEVLSQSWAKGFELDRTYSILEPDDRMLKSFDVSYNRVVPSMLDSDWEAIRNHSAVAYILSPPIENNRAIGLSGTALLITAALLYMGGVAAKGESSGIAHGRDKWIEYSRKYIDAVKIYNQQQMGSILFFTWVRRPLIDLAVYYTCGMHLLGERDAEIDVDVDLDEAIEWIDMLGLYIVGD